MKSQLFLTLHKNKTPYKMPATKVLKLTKKTGVNGAKSTIPIPYLRNVGL